MNKTYVVHLGYYQHYGTHVEVEAPNVETACALAIDADNPNWKSTDHQLPTYVDSINDGEGSDPWADDAPAVPEPYAEHRLIEPPASARRYAVFLDPDAPTKPIMQGPFTTVREAEAFVRGVAFANSSLRFAGLSVTDKPRELAKLLRSVPVRSR